MRPKNRMKIIHGIEYALVRILSFLFQRLPRKTAINLGDRIGRAMDNLWLSRHKTVISNLEIAFGNELTIADKEELSKNIFGNIGMTMAEIARFPVTDTDEIKRIVSSKGEETFQEAIDYGKGALLVGSHFGNWELMGAYINALGFPVDFLIRGQHNKLVDKYLASLRRSMGVRVIHSDKSGGMMEIIRALKQNRQVAIISDQHAGSQGIIINFFGRLVSVPRAPAVLSIRTGAPIITGQILRNPDNTHFCEFDKPLYPNLDADRDKEILRLTKIYTGRIENAIRRQPELWLWTHRRFKYVPKEQDSEGKLVE
ncbi:MAG: lysophospholipid acyltransferase family protein [Candidatus Zixiibacteriota bacterium]